MSLYTKIVDSGGDSWGRRNRVYAGPGIDNEALSKGVEGGPEIQLEGGILYLSRGNRVRP